MITVAVLGLILFVLMALVSGSQGIKSFISIIINMLIIILSVAAILIGVNIYAVMIISSALFTAVTLFYQNRVNVKTLSSLVSIITVLLFISAIIYFVTLSAHITGLNEIQLEEGHEYLYLGYGVRINMPSILITAMIWAELGALIDTSLSITTALNEIKINNEAISNKQLVEHGMSIGKDIIGTTVNTLVFVAFGEALLLFLFYIYSGYTLAEIANSKSFFTEIATVLFSCIGCVAVIPVSSFTFTLMFKKFNKTENTPIE